MPGPRSGTKTSAANLFVASFPARVDELPRARDWFCAWLELHCSVDSAREELTVVYSELTANAVAVSPRPSEEVVTRAWCQGPDVVLEVANTATAGMRPTPWDLHDGLRSGGRGLVIVEAFVDELRTHRDESGRHVVHCRRGVGRS